MTIEVPFRLRRRSGTEPAVALLVPSLDPGAVLGCCARLGLDPSGRVFDVAGGFLLELARAVAAPMPGAIRLRGLAPALYLPVDAELVPSLLDDEASGLVRDWGLVFLPAGRVLMFDRHAPVPLSRLLVAKPGPPRAWRSLPEPPHLADRLAQICFELPEQPADSLYREFQKTVTGNEGDAGPSAGGDRSGSANTGPATALGPAESGLVAPGGAFFLMASMIQSLRALLTRSGETLSALKDKAQWEWVDHSTLLKKLVREFREGDPSIALRRAMPITEPGEPTTPARASDLPWTKAVYSLGELLGRRGRGEPTPALAAHAGLVRALAREYRKAAEQAIGKGDFRRAAYIFGILLHDDRMAAKALQRGGLHRDAALLYLKKLNEPIAAAQAFEAAGAVDSAVTLYRQLGRHEAAGDLLRRIGEEEAAVTEFERAAAQHVAATPADHLAAGRLLLEKARRTDRAIEQFQAGWGLRPQGNAVLCAVEIARIHAQRGAIEPIRALLDQADALFDSPATPSDGFFYNEMTRLAQLPAMEASAEELRDRTLQSLVQTLRGGAASSQSAPATVSALLGRCKLWPAALVSDAEFAATALMKRDRAPGGAPRGGPPVAGLRIGRGVVTAVCQARATGELFLGFDSGQVLAYRPSRDEVVRVADDIGPVSGLAVDPEGATVVALCKSHRQAVMSCFRKHPDGSFRARAESHISTEPDCWLTSILSWGVERLVGLSDGPDLLIIDAASGILCKRQRICEHLSRVPVAATLLPIGPSNRLVVFTHDGPIWVAVGVNGQRLTPSHYRWQPAVPLSSSLRSVPICSRFASPLFELLGLDNNGAVCAARFHAEDGVFELLKAQVAATEEAYLAAAFAGPTTVVAVSPQRIDWLDCSGDRFRVANRLELGVPAAIACFPLGATRAMLVVCADGFVARVVAPRTRKSSTRYDAKRPT